MGRIASRFIPLLTLIPSIFTLISIILINIGGVYPSTSSSRAQWLRKANTAFPLVSWDFTVRPFAIPYYNYSLYLNRFCSSRKRSSSSSTLSSYNCGNLRTAIPFRSNSFFFDTLMSRLRAFSFSSIDSTAPFVLYIIGAVFATMLIVMGVVGFFSKSRRLRSMAAFFNLISFLAVLVASAVLTFQSVRLRNQIRNDTFTTRAILTGTSPNVREVYRINLTDVSLGATVMGLTWTSVVMMLLGTVTWFWAAMTTPRKNENLDREKRTSVDS